MNSKFVRFFLIKDLLKISNSFSSALPIDFSLINNFFIYLFSLTGKYNELGDNQGLVKSQYRPMRKGVTNTIRLQASGAIAIPTEIRLHILASSKDVIHS